MSSSVNTIKYYSSFTTVCIGSLLLSYGLTQLVPNRYFTTPHFWIPTLCLTLITLGANLLLTKGEDQPKEFVFKTLAMSMARLLMCMIIVFIYSMVNKSQALAFACHFMIQYIIFTVFESSFLLKHVKQTN